MKYSFFILVGVLFLTLPAFSELSDADLQRIKEIVKLEVTESELRIQSEIKTEIKTVINEAKTDITEYINTKLKGIDDRLNLMSAFLVAIMASILAAIVLPQVVNSLKQRGQEDLLTEIKKLRSEIIAIKQRGQEDLQTEIKALRSEIEHLKQTGNPQPDST